MVVFEKVSQNQVMQKCEGTLELARTIREDSNINPIVKKMAAVLESRTKRILEISAVAKYNLYFIGKVGVGKSTAISNLLGLIDKDKLEEGYKLNDVTLLKTAQGRTTLCETELHFIDGVSGRVEIMIEPLELDVVKKLVKDLCLQVAGKAHDTDKDGKELLPSEAKRALKNLSGFPDQEEANIEFIKEQLALEEVDESKLSELAEAAILKAIAYESRTTTVLQYDGEGEQSAKQWVKKTFAAINDGKLAGVPYPKKLIIKIAKDDLDLNIPEQINIVKDTRGIDGPGAREDLIAAVKKDNSICIICDEISSFGNIVSGTFFKNHFKPKLVDLKYRNIVLGLEQGAQLKNVNEAESREQGIFNKQNESLSAWDEISFDKDNMLFYNAFYGVKYDNEFEIIKVDYEEYNNEQQGIWNTVEAKIDAMYEAYNNELDSLSKKLEVFSQNSLEEEQLNKLSMFHQTIKEGIEQLIVPKTEVLSEIEKDLRYNIPAQTVRSVVSLKNRGSAENYDIYVQASNTGYTEFDKAVERLVMRLEERCKLLFNEDTEIEKTLRDTIGVLIVKTFTDHREKVARSYSTKLSKKAYSLDVWEELNGYWGDKTRDKKYKYRDAVADTLLKELKGTGYEEDILQKPELVALFVELSETLDI